MERNDTPAGQVSRKRLIAGLPLAIGAILLGRRPDDAFAGTDGDWTTHGNAISGPRFLGTTNNQPLVFKTHNVKRMVIGKGGGVGINTDPVNSKFHVKGTNAAGAAIRGISPNSVSSPAAEGIHAEGTTGVFGLGALAGAKGRSPAGAGVFGDTDTGTAVKGEAHSAGGAVKAVHGKAFGSNANGVVGEASVGTAAYGVWGISTEGYAGVFSGKALVTGNLSKGGGAFKIDHPLDPANKYLLHSFVESPDMMNVYNGNVVTDGHGNADVAVPDYFEALNRDYRYQLTVVGEFAQAMVSRKIEGNSFSIRTDKPNVEVSWQVTGIRQDAFANANRIQVEEDKTGDERGRYLHAEALGKPASRGVQFARVQALEDSSRR